MKLVEADLTTPSDDSDESLNLPPRPERRRISVSLVFTLLVLTTTVVVIYAVVPLRRNALLTRVVALHREPPVFALDKPSWQSLDNWSAKHLGGSIGWPRFYARASAIGAARVDIVNRPAVFVLVEIDGYRVSLIVERSRDSVPRTESRSSHDIYGVSWRHGRWSIAAAGPRDGHKVWRAALGAP